MDENKLVEARPNGRLRVRTVFEDESKTVQADRDRADIRKILAKYEQTGVLVNMARVDLVYRDVSEFSDFSDLMQQTKEAEAAFMRLPSKVRQVFDHDVAKWLDAAHDPEKLEALRPRLEELGVLDKVAPELVKVAEPAPPEGS